MNESLIKEFEGMLENSVQITSKSVKVMKPEVLRKYGRKLAEISALESGERQGFARFITRAAAQDMGIVPASIHELYKARGRGEVPNTFTIPAINLRQLSFEMASAALKVTKKLDGGAIIFEIARSEMGYSDQRPAEFTTTILAAAIAEGYVGPIFIQGDHFQVSLKKYKTDPNTEISALKAMMVESIAAGYFNIDVDTSTLVDLDEKTITGQQKLNVDLSAMLTKYIREIEPAGVTISVGGEIGEVGGHNSNEEELREYLGGYEKELKRIAPGAVGLSKISIQTGTSHGGVVLPDGSIAKVSVDFGTLKQLGKIGRSDYGLGGAVQHGASTLPEDAFGEFVKAETLEVHLATNFTNMYYDRVPDKLRDEMYAYLRDNHSGERKADMTDEQFYYKTRKYAIGPFKKQVWTLPAEKLAEIRSAWEEQFTRLFTHLGMKDTMKYVRQTVKPLAVAPDLKYYLGEAAAAEDVKDLAD
ncbi:MAG: class II fructose-bisphosphate aldolase [Anaerolineaceae bacterium]